MKVDSEDPVFVFLNRMKDLLFENQFFVTERIVILSRAKDLERNK